MLHGAVLPNHSSWGKFFARLKFIVIDEIHTYRGIFGSNVVNVIRRAAAHLSPLRQRPPVHSL